MLRTNLSFSGSGFEPADGFGEGVICETDIRIRGGFLSSATAFPEHLKSEFITTTYYSIEKVEFQYVLLFLVCTDL